MTLYGACIGTGRTTEVRIYELAGSGCDLELDDPAAILDGDCAIWIGAVGPIAGTAMRRADRHAAVRFKEPLDKKILEHFACA